LQPFISRPLLLGFMHSSSDLGPLIDGIRSQQLAVHSAQSH
jgi:hypothetical protein